MRNTGAVARCSELCRNAEGLLFEFGAMTRPILKTYLISDLALSREALVRRCAQITRHTHMHPPEVTFDIGKTRLMRASMRIAHSGPCTVPSPDEARHLAAQIDAAHGMGLVHGDIRPKNLLTTSAGCHLIDWEPSLFQLLNGRLAAMVTPPALHPEDARARNVTHLTDLYGFALLLSSAGSSERLESIQQAQAKQPYRPAGWMADQFVLGGLGRGSRAWKN